MLTITGHFIAPPELRDGLNRALAAHVAHSLQDPGCLRFVVTAHPEIPGRYEVDEAFRTRADFVAHVARVKTSDWWQLSQQFHRSYAVAETTD